MKATDQPDSQDSCACFNRLPDSLSNYSDLGMDVKFAEVSVSVCRNCGQHWLRYFFENEAFTASGRWYLGAITPKQLSALTVNNAKSVMENLGWYYYGGSYYGQTGKTSGEVSLHP